MQRARAHLESLLRARHLDGTLTTAAPWVGDDLDHRASADWPVLDGPLGGGVRRGHLSEIIGARSSGRTTVFYRLAAAATARGELVALVDTHDRFDPPSAAAAGVDLARLLWIRDTGEADRAIKAMMLVLQAGGFGLVACDLADVPHVVLRGVPAPTWLRLARAIEGSMTVALLLGTDRIARSAGGAAILLAPPAAEVPGDWCGTTPRARRLAGVTVRPRIVLAHGIAAGE